MKTGESLMLTNEGKIKSNLQGRSVVLCKIRRMRGREEGFTGLLRDETSCEKCSLCELSILPHMSAVFGEIWGFLSKKKLF